MDMNGSSKRVIDEEINPYQYSGTDWHGECLYTEKLPTIYYIVSLSADEVSFQTPANVSKY